MQIAVEAGRCWHNRKSHFFSDEKLFIVEQRHNAKNDIVHALSIEHVPEYAANSSGISEIIIDVEVGYRKKAKSHWLSSTKVSISSMLNHDKNEILVKPWADQIHGDGNECFQQGSAPVHMANFTQASAC